MKLATQGENLSATTCDGREGNLSVGTNLQSISVRNVAISKYLENN